MEPYRLRTWKVNPSPNSEAYFYTCARPGRSNGPNGQVSDTIVSTWVRGLPGPDTAIILLLGRKDGQEGMSEFSFYSFCGGFDTPSERKNQPTFQEWLNQRHEDLQVLVHEHPTYDFQKLSPEKLADISADFWDLVSAHRTVVVVDSGGQTRTSEVCKYLDAVEYFGATPNL